MRTTEEIMKMVFECPPHLELREMDGLTSAIVCGTGIRYQCELHGPFYDITPGNPNHQHDLRIFVVYRVLHRQTSFHLLVQDADDDVFLNSHVVERYDTKGPVILQ